MCSSLFCFWDDTYYEFVALLPASASSVTGSPAKATMPGLDFSIKRDLFKINSTSDNIFWWKYCVQWHIWKCIFLRLLLLLLLFMCLCVLRAEARKRHLSLWNWSCRWLWGAAKMLGIEPLFPGGAAAAALWVTESSLQPPKHLFKTTKESPF